MTRFPSLTRLFPTHVSVLSSTLVITLTGGLVAPLAQAQVRAIVNPGFEA